jgi:hypothetical protein
MMESYEGELDEHDILCAFVITCPEEITEEQMDMIRKQWTEIVLPEAVTAMQRFVLRLEIPGDRDIDLRR